MGRKSETTLLRERHERNQLALEVAAQESTLAAIGESQALSRLESWDPSNFVDLRDYLPGYQSGYGVPTAAPSSVSDREGGRSLPTIRTEHDLAEARGVSRLLLDWHEPAIGALTALTNYVIGQGFAFLVASKAEGTQELVAIAQQVIDEFIDDNDFCGDLDRELFWRSRRDGEYFLGLWHTGGGRVQARAIEPDQVCEPSAGRQIEDWLGFNECASSWTFGVHTDADDVENRHGYYVQWSANPSDWDYLAGGQAPCVAPHGAGVWVEHAKANTDRNVKRGLPDFTCNHKTFERAQKLLRNLGEGGALQAAIAWINESASGTSPGQIESSTMARADASRQVRTQRGTKTEYMQQYGPGTILKPAGGTKFTPPPAWSSNAPNILGVFSALLRTAGTRWNMPEAIMASDASNNNYASMLAADAPFTKNAEVLQAWCKRSHLRIVWRVLEFAHQAGRFGPAPWESVKRVLEIQVTPPMVAARDQDKETQRNDRLNQARVLSRKTWAAREGLDDDEEQTNLADEPVRPALPAGPPVGTQAAGIPQQAVESARLPAWIGYP